MDHDETLPDSGATPPSVPRQMWAAVYDRYGPPEVMRVASVETPRPGAGEVLVKVLATSLNGGEIQGRSGRLRLVLGNSFPKRTGIDLVGTVVGVGADVQDFRPGERVWAISENPLGTTAEYFAVRRGRVTRAPRTLSPSEAVTLLAGGTTGITALRDHAKLQPGERLLVRGSAGGVGSLVVQLGKLYGAHVTALARADSLDFVRGLGADEAIDYRSRKISELGSFDVIVDSAGSDLRALRRLLAPGGRMVALTIDMFHRLASLGYIAASTVHGPRRVRIFRGDPTPELLTELADLADQGAVRPVVDRSFPLDQVVEAHRALEAGGVRGKHVIEVVSPAEIPSPGPAAPTL